MKVIPALVIAMVCHEINRAYCKALGDDSQPAWDEAPDWQRDSALAGVNMHLSNPDATPEQSHEAWLAKKIAEGWTYGEAKDETQKTHPCCLPWAELPEQQRIKDHLFKAAVHAVASADEAVAATLAEAASQREREAPASAPVAQAAPTAADGEVLVTYIGRRPLYQDRNYRTGLTFTSGQTRALPADVAAKFLRHSDVFAPYSAPAGVEQKAPGEGAPAAVTTETQDDDTKIILEQAAQAKAEEARKQTQHQDMRDQIMRMSKRSLEEFAKTTYRIDLDARRKVDDLRAEVLAMVDRFGVQ